jgi:methionyl-tRNA formyltransferase
MAKYIEQQIRAMNPEPMAWCEFANNPLRIIEAIVDQRQNSLPAGTVFREGVDVLVSCGGKTSLKLLKVQPAGKSEMAANSWANGLQSQEVKLD